MTEEMDRVFGQFQGGGMGQRSGLFPAVEVSERNGQIQVHADLPGIKPEDVKVEITDDALVIRGERKSEHEQRSGGAYRSERHYGEFYREIALPEGVNAEQAKAQFRNGVLEISVPVPQQANRRREIPISAGESGTQRGSQEGAQTASQTTGQSGSGASGQTGSQGKPASSAQSATAGASSGSQTSKTSAA
jgi:HSP20 family protein